MIPEMGETKEEPDKSMTGCGGIKALYNTVFGRRGHTSPRKSSSANASPRSSFSSSANSKRRRGGSDQSALIVPHVKLEPPISPAQSRLGPNSQLTQISVHQKVVQRQIELPSKPPPSVPSISGELDSVIYDHQRSKARGNLVRASSSNVMLIGSLGNLRAGNNVCDSPNRNVFDYLPMTADEMQSKGTSKKKEKEKAATAAPPALSSCRVLSRRLDPDSLKDLGDVQYENGRFAEAVSYYEQATMVNPENSTYWVSKAAALAGLGRFLEAVDDCREAVRIDPRNSKAHSRLAALYLRLGEAEKAAHHYKQVGGEAGSRGVSLTRSLHVHLTKVNDARKRKDWHTVLQEAQSALSNGADSAPQVFALQAEALLKLELYEEAETALIDAPTFDNDECTKFYGSARGAYLFMVRSLVDLASGRFEGAVKNSQRAAQLDPNNREVTSVAKRARMVSSARLRGNELFKASKFSDACLAYGEGLGHDPQNPVLLCNRAACRSKLKQWEKAVEDCNLALNLRPSYAKARLRRADCNAKLEKWDESVQDYELLVKELPGDEEVVSALAEVQSQRKRQERESDDLVAVQTSDQLSDLTKLAGIHVVFFGDKASKSQHISHFLVQLCKKYPSIHFVEVDKEENHKLSDSEGLLPSFRIFKDGSRVKDLETLDLGLLEKSLISLQ